MKIRKAHILARHLFNQKDHSAEIFYTEEGGLFVNNSQEFRRLGRQAYNEQQRRVLLEMPMDSLVGLSRGPERKECTGVLIVYDC
jgi:hypothetical protein